MSSSSETPDPEPGVVSRPEDDRESLYWVDVLTRSGMLRAQATTLAFTPGVDRHAVWEALQRGCDPELAFLIFS